MAGSATLCRHTSPPLLVAALLCVVLMSPAAAQARRAYATNAASNSLLVLDTASNTVVDRISVSGAGYPAGVAITPNGRYAYVTNSGFYGAPGESTVSVIDTAKNAIVTSVEVGMNPAGVAVSPDGSRVYVVNRDSRTVSVIDTETNVVIATVTGLGARPGNPGGIVVTPDGTRAYVISQGHMTNHQGVVSSSRVWVIDTAKNEIVDSICEVCVGLQAVGMRPDGSRAYVPSWAGGVLVIDTESNRVIDEISGLGSLPSQVAITPDGSGAYVTNQGSTTVSRIDLDRNAVAGAIGVGEAPYSVSVTPDGKRALVTHFGTGHVSVVDTAENAVVDTIETGPGTRVIAFVPNQPPVAGFEARPGAVGNLSAFDATRTIDPDGNVARYDWDFGDGSTLENGGPTPKHVYERAGTYTVTLTVTDDEGCSTSMVFTGQTALCNGSSVARKSVRVTVGTRGARSGEGRGAQSGREREAQPGGVHRCVSSLKKPLVSVTHWKSLRRRLRLRLKADSGGYALRSQRGSRFVLQVRGIEGERNRRLRKVRFHLDGRRLKTDRKAPYSVYVDPSSMKKGRHTLEATAHSRYRTERSLRLGFLVSDCEAGAFSVGLSSKRPRTHPDLELRARSGGSHLAGVRFRLSRHLRVRTRGLEGKRIGAVKLITKTGRKEVETLRVGRRVRGAVDLVPRSKFRVRLHGRGTRPVLSLMGIDRLKATGVRVLIYGKRTRVLENPSSCGSHHRFSATLTSVSGEKTLLKRSLKMCKTPR